MLDREGKRTIDVAYTKHEMLEKLQELRTPPDFVNQNKVYILTKEVNEFHALTRDRQIEIVTTHGVRSFVKSLIMKETPIENAFRRMNLTPTERRDYETIIRSGGIVLVSGTDPFHEEEWTGHTLNKWITNQANSSNLIVKDVQNIRQVPYEPQPEVHYMPEMAVAGEFGHADEVRAPDEIPLQDNQRYVRDPKTKQLGIYQAPHE